MFGFVAQNVLVLCRSMQWPARDQRQPLRPSSLVHLQFALSNGLSQKAQRKVARADPQRLHLTAALLLVRSEVCVLAVY
jgi:hypothetical protein